MFGGGGSSPSPMAAIPAPVAPAAPAPPPMFGQQTSPGQKPQAKSSQPTFLGALLPSSNQASPKTLIGQ